MRARQVPVVRTVVEALASAARDEHVVGLVAHVGQRPISLAHSSELRDAVLRFRVSGKVAVAWTETFGEMSAANVGFPKQGGHSGGRRRSKCARSGQIRIDLDHATLSLTGRLDRQSILPIRPCADPR